MDTLFRSCKIGSRGVVSVQATLLPDGFAELLKIHRFHHVCVGIP